MNTEPERLVPGKMRLWEKVNVLTVPAGAATDVVAAAVTMANNTLLARKIDMLLARK
jgi:hypothetical protein